MEVRKTRYSNKDMKDIIIQNLLNKCKQEAPDLEEDLTEHQMVGYYITKVPQESRLVVCSPDLPLPVGHKPTSVSATVNTTVLPPSDVMLSNAMKRKEIGGQSVAPNTHGADDPYQCNICSKTFAVPARLTRHYRTHTGEKPFQCEYCAKSFSVKENLSVHRRIHTKERPYKCEVCARAFEHSGKLHRHMRIHTGERPHKCTVCSKTFIQSGQLVIHMRTHTGEKPYVCTVCSKGFTCSKQLKVHSRTHTGEKPYSCDICGKSFGYNHVLKLHQVAHYGEKVYKCTICNDTFNSKKCMEVHIKSHSEGANISTSDKENSESCNSGRQYDDSPTISPNISPYYVTRQEIDLTRSDLDSNRIQLIQPTQLIVSSVDILAQAAVSVTKSDEYARKICSPPLTLRHAAYFPPPITYEADLEHGNYIRRHVEAAIAVATDGEPLLTPPSSNPVSPAPSSSPDPVEIIVTRQEISLPPRKRSKMILKSMETENDFAMATVRYSSVIQYAKAS